ncbi:hypothetical protein V8C42DRAFT_258953 [Trichoderma barbatum]
MHHKTRDNIQPFRNSCSTRSSGAARPQPQLYQSFQHLDVICNHCSMPPVIVAMNSTIKKSGDARRKTYAACRFTVKTASCEEKRQATKKRKRGNSTGSPKSPYLQRSPFEPCGKFRTCQTLDIGYSVTPSKEWSHMTHCKEFIRKCTLKNTPLALGSTSGIDILFRRYNYLPGRRLCVCR